MLAWGLTLALGASHALAAGSKSSGSTEVVDDLLTGTGGSVGASAPGISLDGALGQFGTMQLQTGSRVAQIGFLAGIVSTPAVVGIAQVFGTTLSFSWSDAVPGNPVGTLYGVQVSTAADYTGVVVTTETYGFSASAVGLLLDTTYFSRIHATFSGGDDSGFVSIGSTMTLAARPDVSTFTAVSSSTVGVGWSSGTAAEGFNRPGTLFEVQLSSDAFATLVASSLTLNNFAELAGLAANTTFYARARAFNGLGAATSFGPASSSATLAAVPGTAVTTFTAVATTSMTVLWSTGGNPVDVTTYTVTVSTDPAGGGLADVSLSTAPAGATPSATVTGLLADTTYYLFVRAVNHQGAPTAYAALGATATVVSAPVAPAFVDIGPYGLRSSWGNGGNLGGEALAAWQVSGSSLPAAREGLALASYGNRLYASGGSNGGVKTEVWSALVNADGTLGAWSAATPLPAGRESHAMAAWAGRLYVVGGSDGTPRSTVWWAPIRADGRLGDWTATIPLPAPRAQLALAAAGGRLYAAGGTSGVSAQTTVYYAELLGDGSVGPWSAGPALPAARSGHAMAASGATLYISGGLGAGIETTVWSSTIAAGAPGAWSTTTPLPSGRTRHGMTAFGGRLQVVGGHDGGAPSASIFTASLGAGGAVGPWSESSALPSGRYLHGLAASGERLYLAGGSDGTAPQAEVAVSSLSGVQYLSELAQDAGFSVAYASSDWKAGTSFDFVGLAPNQAYFGRVRARSRAGVETASIPLTSTITLAAIPVSAPSTFTLVDVGSIGVQWASGGNPGGTEFRAQASTASAFGGTLFASPWLTASTTHFSGLALNTSYYVRVQTRNSALVESPFFVLGSTHTLAEAPSGLAVTSASAAGLALEWSPGVNPAGTRYEAQVATGAAFSPVLQSSVTLSTAAVFSGLLSASTFYARVRALSGSGAPTAFAAPVSTATGLDTFAPAASTGTFAAQSGSADSLAVHWITPGDDGSVGNLVAGSRYFIQWSTADPAGVTWSTAAAQVSVATGPATAGRLAAAIVSGLPSSTLVHLSVWTRDEAQNYSAPSDTFSAFASPVSFAKVDAPGDAGRSPSLAGDRSGDLHLAALGGPGGSQPRYLRRQSGVWSAAETIEAAASGGVALAVDAAGSAQALYSDTVFQQLKLAKRAGSWSASVVENGDFVPGGLAIDAAGGAHASYYEPVGGDLRYARWAGAAWSTATVDGSAGDAGADSALALDAAGRPSISYHDRTAGMLAYAAFDGVAWSTQAVDASGVAAGTGTALALDGDGRAHIAYGGAGGFDVKYASWTGSAWSVSTVEAGAFGGGLALALDGAGRALIAYADSARGDLKLARWTGASWSTQTVDSGGDQGDVATIAVDGSGAVQAAWRDGTAKALKAGQWLAGLAPAAGGSARGQAQAPSGLAGTALSPSQVQWSWTDGSSGELGFALYGSLVSTGPYALVAGTAVIAASPGTGGPKSYIETGLTLGTTYFRYAVAVTSGGAAVSELASAYPFNAADASTPTVLDNQPGDDVWRRSAVALYNVDFADSGGSGLAKFQVKASTMPGGAGPDLVAFTDVVVNIGADTYATDWSLPGSVFSALIDGTTNYVTLKVIDGAGNFATAIDAFYVLKDTTPPVFTDNQTGDDAPRAAGGTLYDVDAQDSPSGLAAFQWSASTTAGSADAAAAGWADVAAVAMSTGYAANWAVGFGALLNGATNFISVRAWDMAGSTRTLIDAFYVIKQTSGSSVGISQPSTAYRSALFSVTGTAADAIGVQGVEVAVQASPPGGLYWSGTSFASVGPVFLPAAGTTAWSFSPGIAWVDGTSYRVVARSSNTAGNYSAVYATATFTFDASSPTATVAAPVPNTTVSTLPSISGTAADVGAGVVSVELRLRRNSDGFWWDFFSEGWSAVPVSTVPTGTASWSLVPSTRLLANLADQTSYYIAARALDAAAPANAGDFFSAGSSTFTFSDTTAPSAVTDLDGTLGSSPGELRLSWTAPGDDGAAGMILLGEYRVQHATFTGAAYSTASAQVLVTTGVVLPGTLHSKTLTGLTPGGTYYLALWTRDDAGNWSSLSNGATVQSTPTPLNKISGHVVKVSSEGITAVLVEALDGDGILKSTTFTLADGSGTYALDGLPPGDYKIQATWTVNEITSSVWIDQIAMGSIDIDFTLQINYSLATLTGTLQTLVVSPSGTAPAGTFASGLRPAFEGARIELFQSSRRVAQVGVPPSGRWKIPNLLPGKYAVRAYNGFDYTDLQDVVLHEGEIHDLAFVFDPLPKDKVFAFPNPASRSVTFRFETALSPLEAQVSVFDIAGTLVREIPGSSIVSPALGVYHAVWDLNNGRGEAVASGVYLFAVKVRTPGAQAVKVIKKVAVVR